MPIYEYRCDGCGFEFEDMQKITDSPIEVCPTCGEPQAHRLISRTNFVLRGTGWYVTDYGKGSGGQAGEQKPPKTKTESPTAPPCRGSRPQVRKQPIISPPWPASALQGSRRSATAASIDRRFHGLG